MSHNTEIKSSAVVNIEDFSVVKLIGVGSQGKVYHVQANDAGILD